MSDEEDNKRAKILSFMDAAKKKKDAQTSNINIEGNDNVVGNNNTVIKTKKVVKKTTVHVTPGEDCISPQQQGILYKLVHEIFDLEQKVKQNPRTHKEIWSTLNNKNGVPSYTLTPINRFEASEKYLRKELGRLNAMRSARSKNPDWRKSRYAFIHTNCKKYNLTEKMRNYIKKNHEATSLTELSDDQLDATYHAVASWRK